jgi:hypothetical protein
MHINEVVWAARQGPAVDHTTPVVLIAVAPDEMAWRDLTALLGTKHASLHVLVLLGANVQSATVRDVCHRFPVIEVGGVNSGSLPESHRPPAVPLLREGEIVAWWTGHQHWRGKALCTDDLSLLRSWFPAQQAG